MNSFQLAVSNILRSQPVQHSTCIVCGMKFTPSAFKAVTTMCSNVCREVKKQELAMAKRKAAKARWKNASR